MFVIRAGAENNYWIKYGRRWAESVHNHVHNAIVEVHLINPTDSVYEDALNYCDRVDVTETNLDPVVYSTYARFLNTNEEISTLWCDIDGWATEEITNIDINSMFLVKPVLRFTRYKNNKWKQGFWLFGTCDTNIISGIKNTVDLIIKHDFRWGSDVRVNDYLEQFEQNRVDKVCGTKWKFYTAAEKQVEKIEETFCYD